MTREAFEQEILYRLKAQRLRTPVMQPEDVVKLVFQAMLGVGHLLQSRDRKSKNRRMISSQALNQGGLG